MKEVIRYDREPLRKPTVTPQGFVKYSGVVARAGIYEYRIDGKITRELRPHEELQSPETLASYDAAPITVEHPPEKDGVTAENVRRHEVGSVSGAARADGDEVIADSIVVKDAAAIRLVKAGKQELSPGTKCLLDETPGADSRYAYPGNPTGRYDAVQRRIRVNHLALTDNARGGAAIRLRTDSAERVRRDGEGKLTTVTAGHQHLIDLTGWDGQRQTSGTTSCSMSAGADVAHDHPWTLGLDGRVTIGESAGHTHHLLDGGSATGVAEYIDPSGTAERRADAQIDQSSARREPWFMDKDEQIRSLKEQLAAAEAKLIPLTTAARTDSARADTAEATIATLRSENTELRAQIASAAQVVETAAVAREKTRADSAEQALRDSNADFDTRVAQRVALERKAAVVMGPEYRMDGVPNREVLATVVRRLDAQQDTSAKVTDAYLQGRFDSLLDLHNRNARSLQRVGDVIAQQDERGRETRTDSLEEKRAAMRKQGTEPLPNSREAARAQGRA